MSGFISGILSALTDIGHGHALILFSLVAARLVTLVILVPFLGSKNAPGPVKMGIALMLAVLLWPIAIAQVEGVVPWNLFSYIVMILKEVFVGFTLGFVTAQIFYAAEMAGQIIDVARMTNQAQLMVPELPERSSPYGDLNYQLVLLIFLSLGLHQIFFEGLVQSFIAVPINQMPPFSFGVAAFYEEFMFLLGEIFKIAVTLALPIIAVCFITNLSFGLINRIAPQINAYFLAMPATAMAGMAISFFALSMTLEQFQKFSVEMLEHYLKVIRLLG